MSWTLIEHQALTSSVASVTLGSGGTIPQTYKTLKLVVSVRADNASTFQSLGVRLNGDTGSNYTSRYVIGNGSTASSGTISATELYAGDEPAANATASTFSNVAIDIPNYTGSTKKPVSTDAVMENNATLSYQSLVAQLWDSTSAITSITLRVYNSASNNFVSGSTFTLYGLA